MDVPISTLGPSGPRELPVPRVKRAAVALRKGTNAASRLELWSRAGRADRSVLRMLTIKPPKTGNRTTRVLVESRGSSLNQDAPR
uniref:Chloride channel protein n=1 Tax=Rhizophora mucronata TaxID=61149 RepID=A0A2P2KC38_RHIMU